MSYKMKTFVIVLIAVLFLALGGFGTYFYIKSLENKTPEPIKIEKASKLISSEDSLKFKEEYESLNTVLNDNGENKYLTLSIPEANGVKYATINDVEDLFDGNTGVIYFGFPTCPWCRNALPVLIDAASKSDISTIYYMNIKQIRDKKSLDENGNVVTESEGTPEYRKLLELFGDSLDLYDGLNDTSIKRIYAPTVFFIKDGKVVSKHTGTLDSQENPKIELTPDQKDELKNIYLDGFKKINQSDFICDEDRNC